MEEFKEGEIFKKYQELRPKFEQFCEKIKEIIEHELNSEENQIEHLPNIYRIKEFDSFLKKIHRKKCYDYPFDVINDLLGVRVITYYESDLKKVENLILDQFEQVEPPEDKKDDLSSSEFGYRSIHYIVKLDKKRKNLPECRDYRDLYAEIQIRTISQQAWAEIQHQLEYKPMEPNMEIPDDLKRRINRLSALFEIADHEFDSIRQKYTELFKQPKKKKIIEIIIEKKALKEIIEHESFFLEVAVYFLIQKQFKDTLNFCNKALKINSSYKNAWLLKGLALSNLKRYNESIECYEKAIEIGPIYKEAWNNKGVSLRQLERYKESIDSFNKAIEIDPNYLHAWNNKGFNLFKLKEYKNSIKCYNKALEIDPNYKYAWNNKGLCF